MERTIRAKYRNGVIEPLEKLDLGEGEKFLITIKGPLISQDRFERWVGSWKVAIDCEQPIKDIHESRRLSATGRISLPIGTLDFIKDVPSKELKEVFIVYAFKS